MNHVTTNRVRTLSLALATAALLGTPALAGPNNSATISCGSPSKQNKTVTVTMHYTKPDGTKGKKEWMATIPGGAGYTANDKARDIAAAGPGGCDLDGDGDDDITVSWVNGTNALKADANDGAEITGFSFSNDKTNEAESHNVFAAVFDTEGAFGLAGVAQGHTAQGEPGYVQLAVGGAEAFIPTFPGMEAIEIELIAMDLVGAQPLFPDLPLVQLYPEAMGDGQTLWLQHIGPEGLFVNVQDVGLDLDIAGLFNVNAGGNPCAEDIDGDGVVSFGDLLAVLSNWGPCFGCPADLDGDGVVSFSDLLAVLAAWGGC